ncbi:hypothetical protein [Streptomyces sp. MZ04]|uniref:hypothetical protein n=1 Tax=Streptomyces sp. MZ04 TaxID=2559236 RepID=UPI00107E7B24|nr:hypothetical protein [Streptomyces sp. MZ04]TGB15521.1 hypothetical protein E2651_02570 [Streptomyces sp. MZ04]
MSGRWHQAIAELRAQGDAARAATRRVREIDTDATISERNTAVAIKHTAETDYLRSALILLHVHLADRRPPRRLPVARVWPCLRDAWRDQALNRLGGVWRTIPRRGALEQVRSAPPEPLLDAVIEQAEALQASLTGHRRRDRMYESYIPSPTSSPIDELVGNAGRSAPTLPGFPDPGHPLNRAFPRGQGTRIRPDRIAAFNQLATDRASVHQRALAFGDAVLALLVEHRADGVRPQAGKLRGVGRWVAREQALVPHRPTWPDKLSVFQIATLAGLALLVMTCTGLPLTFGQRAQVLASHGTLLFLAAGAIVGLGIGAIYRFGPKLIQAPGVRAAVPGAVAAVVALFVGQGQGPVADHFFAGPYDRYEREYTDGCLAASPYRHDAVQSRVSDGVLIVVPIGGGTTLRLGPAEDGGMHPLRPVGRATRTVLDKYGC